MRPNKDYITKSGKKAIQYQDLYPSRVKKFSWYKKKYDDKYYSFPVILFHKRHLDHYNKFKPDYSYNKDVFVPKKTFKKSANSKLSSISLFKNPDFNDSRKKDDFFDTYNQFYDYSDEEPFVSKSLFSNNSLIIEDDDNFLNESKEHFNDINHEALDKELEQIEIELAFLEKESQRLKNELSNY